MLNGVLSELHFFCLIKNNFKFNIMVLFRFLIGIFILLYVIYYVLVCGHLLELWKITDKEMEFKKLLIPFYYLKHLKS